MLNEVTHIEKGLNCRTVHLKPSLLRVAKKGPMCDGYQRDVNKRVKKIADNWDWVKFNPPKVSYRDGAFWIVDGQHTVSAYKMRFGDKPIECRVFYDLTYQDECIAFANQLENVVIPTITERFRALVSGENEQALLLIKLTKMAGFNIVEKNKKTPFDIVGIKSIKAAYEKLGADAYVDMMRAIREAWGGDYDATYYSIIRGMTNFYATFSGQFTHEALVKSLKRVTPAEVIRKGKSNPTKNGYAKFICETYNKKRTSNRLDYDKL